MSDQKNGPLKRVNDALDLASISVQGEAASRATAQRVLRFILGTSPLFPKETYSELDAELAVLVTARREVVKARILRPSLVLAALLSLGTAAPGIVSVVRNEYGSSPVVEQGDEPDILPTPAAPAAGTPDTDYTDSPIWKN